MKKNTIFLSFLLLLAPFASSEAQDASALFREAADMYRNGSYLQARALFEKAGTPLAEAYAALCGAKVNSSDYPALVKRHYASEPSDMAEPLIHFEAGRNLFAGEDFAGAAGEFALADPLFLSETQQTELIFKKGYAAYKTGRYASAVQDFVALQGRPYSSYTNPACFYLAYMAYSGGDFKVAEQWFRKTLQDSRFSSLAKYYIAECRFMDKDYGFVVENAPVLMDSIPSERRDRLARILSETYLVLGENDKALQYLGMAASPSGRLDFFHAASVRYAVGDYEEAIKNFEAMQNFADSVGQIAAYELAYSYIRTGDKIAAQKAFGDAAATAFDKKIQEDAAFNYAKLAFDLNGDTGKFEDYIQKYPSGGREEQIYNYMAIAALNKKDYAAAIDNYSQIEELDDAQMGNYVKANYLRASALMSGGSRKSAIPYLKAAGFHYPKTNRFNQLSRYWLAEAYYNTGEYAAAAEIWENLYNTDALYGQNENILLPYNVGYSYYCSGKYDSAAKWFDIFLKSGSGLNREDALTRRADCDFARHSYKNAINSYSAVIKEFGDVNKIYPYFQQALAYGLSGQKGGKLKVLMRVKDASPEAPLYDEAMYELGRAYMENADYNGAAEVFETLRSSTSDNTFAARALIGKGMAFRNMKNYDSALEQYKQVVSLLPGSEYSEEALLAINSIYRTSGTPEKYIEYVERNGIDIGKSASEKESIYFNTAEQIYLAGNYSEAVKYLRKFISDYPDASARGDASFYLAESYRGLGENEKAAACYADALKYLSEGSFAESAALAYGQISFGLEHFEDAYKGYSKLLELAKLPENKPVARLGMLRSAYAARNWQDAVSAAESIAASSDGAALKREAEFTKAKALLAQSRRDDAFGIFRSLATLPTTAEGAESAYMLVQDLFDRGRYDEVESAVYSYADKFGEQTYWLARCYVVLAETFAAKGNEVQAKATLQSIKDGYKAAEGGDDIASIVELKLQEIN